MKQSQVKFKKIGIDARFFGPKDKGFGRYTQKLIENLEKTDHKNQYFIFLRKERWNNYQAQNSNFKKVLTDYRWYGWKEQIFLPLKLKKYKLDLVHFTHFNVPIFYRGKFIVTIHDLTLRHFPTYKKNFKNLIFYPFKNLAYKIVFKHAIKNSEKIIAISEYTKKDILKYYKVNPDKIKVIYEGVPENFKFQISNFKSNPNLKFQIKKPYLLYMGNAYPHKNLKRLILTFNKLNQEPKIRNQGYKLVLVGQEDYFYKKLKLEIRNLKLEIGDKIIFPGFISDEGLDVIYRAADLYVFPSLSEGFGLPPLEAMTRGVPVASSNATCLPEILGSGAIYFNPLDIDDIAETIKKVLINENLRKELIKKGFEQIKKYSWKKMAEKTSKLYFYTM